MSPPGAAGPSLHCVRAGEGPPILFLHAGAGTHVQWLPYFHRFARRHRCLAPDLFGHGASPSPPGTTAANAVGVQVSALRRLLDELAEPAHVVGHSYGAVMGLMTALAVPERVASLVLVEPPIFTLLASGSPEDRALLSEVEAVEAACRAALAARDPLRASELFTRYWSGPTLWDELPDVFRHLLASGAVDRHDVGIAAMFTAALPSGGEGRLARHPVTVVRGTTSPAPARRIAERLSERLPRARLVTIPRAGHLLPSTHVADFLTVLRRHLAEAAAAADAPGAA